MKNLLRLSVAFAGLSLGLSPTLAQGYINPPIYATGVIYVQPGGTVNTQVRNAVNPNNLNVFASGPISNWTITLPFPAFGGQIVSVGCPGGNVTTLHVIASNTDTVNPGAPTSCASGNYTLTQFQYNEYTFAWTPISITGPVTINIGTLIDVASPPAYLGTLTPVICDGTDQTAHLNALLAAIQTSAQDGHLQFHACNYIISSAITIPNDNTGVAGVNASHQVGLVFEGVAPFNVGEDSRPNSATVLDLRGTDTVGRIKTLGIGTLRFTNITLTSTANSTGSPLLFTTNTTLLIDHSAFLGSANIDGSQKTGPNKPNEAGIVLGGKSVGPQPGPGLNDYFQGYLTVIDTNYFDQLQVNINVVGSANSVVISNNFVQRNGGCGSLTTCGAFRVSGIPTGAGYNPTGTTFINNKVEVSNYSYVYDLQGSDHTQISGADTYDDVPGVSLAVVNIASGGQNTNVIMSMGLNMGNGQPFYTDPSNVCANSCIFFGMGTTQVNILPATNIGSSLAAVPSIISQLVMNPNSGPALIQPQGGSGAIGGNKALRMLRGAADTSPNTPFLEFAGDGSILINSSGVAAAPGIVNSSSNGLSLQNNLRDWVPSSGTGGNMNQFSGSSGNIFTMRNFEVLFTRYDTAAQVAQIGPQFGGSAFAGIGFGTTNQAAVFYDSINNAIGLTAPAGGLRINGTAGASCALYFYVNQLIVVNGIVTVCN